MARTPSATYAFCGKGQMDNCSTKKIYDDFTSKISKSIVSSNISVLIPVDESRTRRIQLLSIKHCLGVHVALYDKHSQRSLNKQTQHYKHTQCVANQLTAFNSSQLHFLRAWIIFFRSLNPI